MRFGTLLSKAFERSMDLNQVDNQHKILQYTLNWAPFSTFLKLFCKLIHLFNWGRGHHGRDHMIVGFPTTCAISAYHHWSCEFESCSSKGVLGTTLCDKVCQWLATGRWFSPGTLVSSTNKADRHNTTEVLLKVALNTITLTLNFSLKEL
jgi:hypothetical protein